MLHPRIEDQAAHKGTVEELRGEVEGRLGMVQDQVALRAVSVEAQLQSAAQHVETVRLGGARVRHLEPSWG